MLRLEGPGGRLEVDARRGAKITSLVDHRGLEWLTTTPRRRVIEPGAWSFTEAEMCGWDECAPSIETGVLPDGRMVADHGDVWDRPWQVLAHTTDELTCQVVVPSLGFGLSRRIRSTGHGFRLDYSAWATGERSLPLLWAAHPQFRATGLLIEVEGLHRVRQVWPQHAENHLTWAGVPQPATRSAKYWATSPVLPSRATLRRGGSRLDLRWRGAPLRGLALWFDVGDIASEPCVAVEPATGRGDAVTALRPPDEVALVAPGRPLAWTLEVDFVPPETTV